MIEFTLLDRDYIFQHGLCSVSSKIGVVSNDNIDFLIEFLNSSEFVDSYNKYKNLKNNKVMLHGGVSENSLKDKSSEKQSDSNLPTKPAVNANNIDQMEI